MKPLIKLTIPKIRHIQDWLIFDKIPERVYTMECDRYVDKNKLPINDEMPIKHLTSGEPINDDIELFNVNKNALVCRKDNKYDLKKATKQI